MSRKKALVIIATGSETVEIVAPTDILRGCGLEVTIASIHGNEPVKACDGILIVPDIALKNADKDAYDAIILPGGLTGSPNMSQCELVGDILKHHHDKGKLIAAICLGPTVLHANGIGFGRKITSYPPGKELLSEKYDYVENPIVQDGNIITSRGPGTVWNFALKIAENLVGIEETKRVAERNLLSEFLDKKTFK
ncbi:protein dj-1beta-like [Chironomus tepperi]|uniref:protein dj-1beta-like n=1 Tax=Chironomus tepperi TaxID=113505 RepID=UPI00391F35C5